jgi:hypothetical protein
MEWTSVEERLPELPKTGPGDGPEAGRYLVYAESIQGFFVARYYQGYKEWPGEWGDASGAQSINKIATHWMSLPPPPEVE